MGFNPLGWLVSKLHPDFNKNGIDDVKELQDGVNALMKQARHAIETLDYKLILVHMTDIMDYVRQIQYLVGQINSLVNTAEVKAAYAQLIVVLQSFLALLQSFASAKKIAMLEQPGGDMA